MYDMTSGAGTLTALPYRGRRTVHGKTHAMTAGHFIALSAYLYGETWKAEIACETATDASKIREMANDKRRVSPKIATHLLETMAAHREEFEEAQEIAREAAVQFDAFVAATDQNV